MIKKVKKTITKKKLETKIAVKAPVANLNVPAPERSPLTKEGGPMDISTMDHASGLSGMPTPSGQK